MALTEKELGAKWLELAESDLKMAEVAAGHGLLLHSSFHLQQACEKSLKGLHVVLGFGQPPYTHNLSRLAAAIDSKFHVNATDTDFLSQLEPFYVRSRYPDYKKSISEILNQSLVLEFLSNTKRVVSWLEQKTH
jgi:HEPN domain-containing protein